MILGGLSHDAMIGRLAPQIRPKSRSVSQIWLRLHDMRFGFGPAFGGPTY